MSAIVYLLTLCLLFGTILIVYGMRYLAATQQAKARLASDEAYRTLAAQATAAQTETAAALAAANTALADIQVRLANVEKILKDVE